MKKSKSYLDYINEITDKDAQAVYDGHKKYGASCLKRGGAGLYHVGLARKIDRIEHKVSQEGYDILKVLLDEELDPKGLIDDIRDLRVYLVITEAEASRRLEEKMKEDNPIMELHEDGSITRADTTGQENPFGFDEKEDV